MAEPRYVLDSLSSIPIDVRNNFYKALTPICGRSGLELKDLLIPDRRPTADDPAPLGAVNPKAMFGRLVLPSGEIVGGILYKDNRPDVDNSVERYFVCTRPGLLALMNRGFEEGVLADKRTTGKPIRSTLMSIVDPERKIAKAHMKNGYKILASDPLKALWFEKSSIPMERYIGSPLPTPSELEELDRLHAAAAEIRAKIIADSTARGERPRDPPERFQPGGTRRRRRAHRYRRNIFTRRSK
jgi:hypothetical protein